MHPNDRFVYLFRRYMAKTYTRAEKDEIMACLQQPGYDSLLRELLREGSEQALPAYEQAPEKADAAFAAIMTAGRPLQTVPRREQGAASFIARHWMRYAAVMLVIIGSGLGALYYHSHPGAKAPAALAARPAAPKTMPAEHRYIVLSDGSKVLLNTGSHLSYPPEFNRHSREVQLVGEAYFDIHSDSKRPFIVHAGKVRTVVLGTAFDIKAFPGQKNVVVTVTHGKVRVENAQRTLGVLTRNEQLTVDDKAEQAGKQLVKTEEVMSWKAEDVLFDDMPVSEAVAELQKRFGIGIRLQNPDLGNCRVTASFLHHETPEEIIKVLCGINRMQYRMETNNNIVLTGEGCR